MFTLRLLCVLGKGSDVFIKDENGRKKYQNIYRNKFFFFIFPFNYWPISIKQTWNLFGEIIFCGQYAFIMIDTMPTTNFRLIHDHFLMYYQYSFLVAVLNIYWTIIAPADVLTPVDGLCQIGSGNGLLPVRRQAITRINADLLSIESSWTKLSENRLKCKNCLTRKCIWKECQQNVGHYVQYPSVHIRHFTV